MKPGGGVGGWGVHEERERVLQLQNLERSSDLTQAAGGCRSHQPSDTWSRTELASTGAIIDPDGLVTAAITTS